MVIDSLVCASFITSLSTSTSALHIHMPVFLKFSIIGILLWAGHIFGMYDGIGHFRCVSSIYWHLFKFYLLRISGTLPCQLWQPKINSVTAKRCQGRRAKVPQWRTNDTNILLLYTPTSIHMCTHDTLTYLHLPCSQPHSHTNMHRYLRSHIQVYRCPPSHRYGSTYNTHIYMYIRHTRKLSVSI